MPIGAQLMLTSSYQWELFLMRYLVFQVMGLMYTKLSQGCFSSSFGCGVADHPIKEPCLRAQKYSPSPSECFFGADFAVCNNLFCCEFSHVYSIVARWEEHTSELQSRPHLV